MKRYFALLLCLSVLAAVFPVSAQLVSAAPVVTAPVTYTVTLTNNGDGTATIEAAVPAGAVGGKIVVTPSANLTYIAGSLKGDVPTTTTNENYNRDGVAGQCVSFASSEVVPAGAVVFEAKYTIAAGAELGEDDIICPLWNLNDGVEKIGSQANCDVEKVYVAPPQQAPVTYTVTLTNNGDGTATIEAAVPAGANGGKIVVTPSAKLTYIAGSLKGDAPGTVVNGNYNRDGIVGQCAVFASSEVVPAGAVVFRAKYAIAEGAELGKADIICRLWNITGLNLSGDPVKVGSNEDGDVIRVYVLAVTYTVTFADWNGATLKTETVVKGENATPPSAPSRTGYTFIGWNGSCENVTGDRVITAQYRINTYTVTFKDWNGTVLKTQTVNYGGSATPPPAPSRTGYTFTKWNGSYTNVTGNRTLKALYTINSYTVTFTINGEFYSSPTFKYGAAVTAPVYEAPANFRFSGWDVPATMPAQDLTLDAVLCPKGPAPITYTVTLTSNGDGTATITATLPVGVASGKIVIGVSANLTLVPDSLKSTISGASKNENYKKGRAVGACVAFSAVDRMPEGTEAFSALYRIAEGAELSEDDFFSYEWNISDGKERIGSQNDGDIIKRYVTAMLGDVNKDGEVDNLDSSLILQFDSGLEEFTAEQMLIGDVNRDGEVDNLDASLILQFDAGLVEKF